MVFSALHCRMLTAGEIVLFDRSWYNRGVVEPVMGFCTPQEVECFLAEVPRFEKMLVEDGMHLVKIWLTIGREMQVKRFHLDSRPRQRQKTGVAGDHPPRAPHALLCWQGRGRDRGGRSKYH